MNNNKTIAYTKAVQVITALVLGISLICLALKNHISMNVFYAIFSAYCLRQSRKTGKRGSNAFLTAVMFVGSLSYIFVSCFMLGRSFGHFIGVSL